MSSHLELVHFMLWTLSNSCWTYKGIVSFDQIIDFSFDQPTVFKASCTICFCLFHHNIHPDLIFHSCCWWSQILQKCLSVLNPPKGVELAPYAFLLCVVLHTPLAPQFQSFFARCGYKSNKEALGHFALSSPTLFLGGASVVCEKMAGINMNTWKEFAMSFFVSNKLHTHLTLKLVWNRGWNGFFDSFTLVLSNIDQETLARDRVRKTLKARIWPFLKALLLSIGKEPEHCDAVEKSMVFLPLFMDKVVLIDTDSLLWPTFLF